MRVSEQLALLGNGKRSASAVTTTTSIVFTVEKESYERTLQKVHEQELDSVITFLRSIFLFQSWSDEELRRLASCTTRRRRAHPFHDRRARRALALPHACVLSVRPQCCFWSRLTSPRLAVPILQV